MPRGACLLTRLCRTAVLCSLFAVLAPSTRATAGPPQSIASLTFDLTSGVTLSVEQPDIIGRAVLPGSVMKVAAIAAALEHNIISPRTAIVCTRSVVVDGHRLTCTHPDLHRPLTPAEALSHSCNVYVATIAARLPRAAFDRTRASLGLPPSGTASVQASALGVEGTRVVPRTLALALARIGSVDHPPAWKPTTLDVLRRGLVGATTFGTASALGASGIDALAKTGTVDAGGVSQGLIVGVTPSTNPTRGFALLVSGGAGMDAASLIAARLLRLDQPRTGASGAERRQTIRIGVTQPDGHVIARDLPLDDYVAGVIAGEQAAGSAPAALDALAIAARTYALANAGRHKDEGFDLCDLTHCQVLRPSSTGSRASAMRTTGQYLVESGKPAAVFYTASCGGHTERPSLVWRGATDSGYLPSQPDDACGRAPAWESQLSARDLRRALAAAGFKGDALRGLRIASRTSSGRAAWIELDGLSPARVSGENLRTIVGRTLGWQHLRSTLFEVTRTGSGYRFRGTGAGHGVGLCVLGAAERARHGADVATILREYYPGLMVASLHAAAASASGPGVAPALRLELPSADRAAGQGLEQQAARWLEETRARLGAATAVALLVRFHPTVESYQRVTGSPWFTTGTTRPGTIDLLPLSVLRERGLLESTLRHEFAHALTREALRDAPMWMHEGVAEWAAGGNAATLATASPGCPTDVEFSSAASGEALRRIYARARLCYERELEAGRSWRAWTAAEPRVR